jgi:redox-sensitive bicupin YhaK (pirin superfamily)
MGAGRGVMHSEFNHGSTPVHLLQIWIQPRARGLPPRYAQKRFELARRQGQWCPLALPPERIAASDPGAALPIEADAALYAGCFDGDQRATYPLDPARLAYVHVVRGRVRINGQPFTAGDAAMIRQEAAVELSAGEQAEVLLFDLAPSSAFPAG